MIEQSDPTASELIASSRTVKLPIDSSAKVAILFNAAAAWLLPDSVAGPVNGTGVLYLCGFSLQPKAAGVFNSLATVFSSSTAEVHVT